MQLFLDLSDFDVISFPQWKMEASFIFSSPSSPSSQFLIFIFLFSSCCCCCLIAFGILNVLKSLVLIPHTLGFLGSSAGKESSCNAGDPSLIPGLGSSPGERIGCPLEYSGASLVAQLVRSLPPTGETWVLSLGWEDPLEKGKATHCSILVWRMPWTIYSPWVTKSQTQLSDFHFHMLFKLYHSVGKYWKAFPSLPGTSILCSLSTCLSAVLIFSRQSQDTGANHLQPSVF